MKTQEFADQVPESACPNTAVILDPNQFDGYSVSARKRRSTFLSMETNQANPAAITYVWTPILARIYASHFKQIFHHARNELPNFER